MPVGLMHRQGRGQLAGRRGRCSWKADKVPSVGFCRTPPGAGGARGAAGRAGGLTSLEWIKWEG